MPQEWQEEGDYSELEKPVDTRIRRQRWVGALQEEFIGSINKRGNFESRNITSSPYGWKNHSFPSAKGDSDRLKLIFLDSKVQYVIKYGIADHLKKQLIYDVKKASYSFLSDETTNSQVKNNMMGMWSIVPKALIILSIHTVDRYLLGIALLSIWLSIMRNLWNSWTLIPSSCFILGWMDPMLLTCPFRTKLHRSCLRWIHSSSSWDHVHSIQFTLHFKRGLSSFFRDRFHQQHQTVKVLENFLRRKKLLIWTTFSLTSIPFLNFLALDVRITFP